MTGQILSAALKSAELSESVLTKSLTEAQYGALVQVYSGINSAFFAGTLPEVMFILDYRKSKYKGYFHYEKLEFRKDGSRKESIIALNPDLFDESTEEILATLLHEMCHCWESYSDPEHQPRGGYHDRKWTDKMRSVGLEPVFMNTSRTSVSHTIVPDGPFDRWFRDMPVAAAEDIILVKSAFKRESGASSGGGGNRNKVKYTCPSCLTNVWGKPGLRILCSKCSEEFLPKE